MHPHELIVPRHRGQSVAERHAAAGHVHADVVPGDVVLDDDIANLLGNLHGAGFGAGHLVF